MITTRKYQQLEYIKNISSFWRNCFILVIHCYKIQHYQKITTDCETRLRVEPNTIIKEGSTAHRYLANLIEARMRKRISTMELFHGMIRFLMLWFRLEFPQYDLINPITFSLHLYREVPLRINFFCGFLLKKQLIDF